MSGARISSGRVRRGVWEAALVLPEGAPPPHLVAIHNRRELPPVALEPDGDTPGLWELRLPIPAEILSDGVQTIVVAEAVTGATLGTVSFVCGQPVETDLRAEIDLLRAELDLVKSVLRRHLSGSGIDGSQP